MGVVVSSSAPIVMSTDDLVAVSPDASPDAFGAVLTRDGVAASIHTFVSGLTEDLVAVSAGASVDSLQPLSSTPLSIILLICVKCCFFRARNLKSKNQLGQFDLVLNSGTYQLIAVCETWLNPSIPDSLINGQNKYMVFRKDSIDKRGRGVGLFVYKPSNLIPS